MRRNIAAWTFSPVLSLDLPVETNTTSVSCALDVLEHVEDDKKALSELIIRVTKPGGIIVINVPAFMFLWSDWDVSARALSPLQHEVDARATEA